MLVFWRQKLVFLATTKTASTSIEAALSPLASMVVMRPPHLKHTTVQKYRRFIAPYLGGPDGLVFDTTALMREPLDWLGSWYRYRMREDEVPEKSTRGISFETFIRAYCQDEDRPEYANIGAQSRFLTPQGPRPVDHIFRYERMDLFVDFMQDRLGVKIDLPTKNISPKVDIDLSPKLRDLLQTHRAADFALYDSLA